VQDYRFVFLAGLRRSGTTLLARLAPIPPSEPVEGGAEERYFAQWQALKRNPSMRAYLDLAALRYERRTRRWGYSLLRP
jgi:hypothetical protein